MSNCPSSGYFRVWDLTANQTSEYQGVIPAPSQFSRIVNERDPACRISDFVEMTQVAHLVPRDERSWVRLPPLLIISS